MSAPRVLVVDDDVVSVGQTLRWLRTSGYLGAGAASAERAQALLRSSTFDLMMVKTRLPFVGGVRLMQLACAERPELRVLLIGERPIARLELEARRCGGQYVLEPNSRKALAEAIASMLPDARPLQRWPRKHLSRRFPVRVLDSLGMLVDVSYGGFCVEIPAGEGALPDSFDVAVDEFDLQIHAKAVWCRRHDDCYRCGAMLVARSETDARWRLLVDLLPEPAFAPSARRRGRPEAPADA